MKKIIVAIDGHSSCGKSTMAKQLARTVGYIYIDTGAMYRAVTLYALRHNIVDAPAELQAHIEAKKIDIHFQFDAVTERTHTYLNDEDVETEIRGMAVSSRVSVIAAMPFVRTFLVAQQQAMGRERGIVMDGRDICSVVFPKAELKIFVTATPEVRARRRYDELRAKGDATTYEDVLRNVTERDRIDSTRAVAPLRPTADALILDNSTLTRDEQNAWLLDHFHAAVEAAQ